MSRKRIIAILCITIMLVATSWLAALPAYAAALTGVSNAPTSAAAGATTTHTVAFTTATSLPGNAKIAIDFPAGFNVAAATLGTVTGPAGPFTLSVTGQTVIVTRDGTALPFSPGAVSIAINNIVNTQTSGSGYQVTVTTKTIGDIIIDGPTNSASFTVTPNTIHHYSVSGIASPRTAGTAFNVTIQAQDIYNNNISTGASAAETVNLSFAQADGGATPASVTTAAGTATASVTMTVAQTGQAVIFTGATSSKTGTSNNFTVSTAGAIHHYSVSGVTSPRTAGTAFNVTIQAQDIYNNNITTGASAAETVNLSFAQVDGSATPASVTTAGGTATASVTMTVAQGGQAITFTGATSGKTGASAIFTVNPGAIHHYSVSNINSPQTAGTAFNVTIQAQDIYNNNITTGAGAAETVNLSFAQADGGATPASVTTAAGTATASVTMTVPRIGQTITFTGATSGKTVTSNVFNVIAANSLTNVSNTPTSTVAGTATTHTVDFTTASNLPANSKIEIDFPTGFNVAAATLGSVTGPAGPFTLSVTGQAIFLTRNAGADFAPGAVSITLNNITNTQTSGIDYKVTVTTETIGGSIIDGPTDSASFTIVAGAIHHYSVSNISSPQTTGTAFNVTIQAQDIYNNNITTGADAAETVNLSFAQVDGGATPASVTTASGTAMAIVTMTVAQGGQAITFTGATSAVSGTSAGFTVNPEAIHHYSVSVINSPQTAGTAFNVTIQAQDIHNNNITTGADAAETVNLSFAQADGGATPASVTTVNGTATASVTMTVAQSGQTITFTGATSAVTGTSVSFTVNPGAIHHYSVSAINSPRAAGTPFNVTIQAQDIYNNNITTGASAAETVNLSFAQPDTSATPASVTTAGGTATASVTMTVAQNGQTVTFTGATSGKTGTSASFTVSPGAIHHYAVSSLNTTVVATHAFDVTIQAQDIYNNNITAGTYAAEPVNLSFARSDPGATPISVTTDNGTATVSITMTVRQIGQTVTFTGVGSYKSGTSETFNVLAANYTFTLNTLVFPSEGGSVSPSSFQGSYGTSVTLTATPASGYTFSYWAVDASGTSTTSAITLNSDKTVYAFFTPITYYYYLDVDVVTQGAGWVSQSPTYSQYTSGSTVTLTATPQSGYTFAYWSGDASGNLPTTTITMNADKNITAHFSSSTGIMDIYNTPASTLAGASTTYTVDFTTISNLPGYSKIEINFPAGFDLSAATLGNVTGPTGPFTLSVVGQAIFITRNTGVTFAPGPVSIMINNITNTQSASNDYKATVTTKTAADILIDGPTDSIPFAIVPEAIHHYSVSDISPSQAAWTPFSVTIQAQDVYNNNITTGASAAETVNFSFAQADGGATPISVTTTGGTATASVTMTVAQSGQAITFTGATSGKTGLSGSFDVIAGEPVTPIITPNITDLTGIVNSNGVFTSQAVAPSSDNIVTVTINADITGVDSSGAPLTQIIISQKVNPPSPPTDTLAIGLVYDISPDGAVFDRPVTITIKYNPADLPSGTSESALYIAWYDESTNKWINLPSTVDTVNKTVSARVSHFSDYVILAPSGFNISRLTITPEEVEAGKEVTINAIVTNNKDLPGDYDIALKINDQLIETKQVTLAGHESQTVTFITSQETVGIYNVSVGSVNGVFIVTEPATPAATSGGVNPWLIVFIIIIIIVVTWWIWKYHGKRIAMRIRNSSRR